MNHTTEPEGDDPFDAALPADAAATLSLLQEQQRKVDRASLAPIPWLYAIWGVAWLVGFILLWSSWPDGNPWFQVDGVIAGWVFAVLTVGSIVASAVLGSRVNRGVRGASEFQGIVYGVSWSVCGVAFAFVGVGLIYNGMSDELASVYFPSAYALMVGTLYIAGAALWRSISQLVVGVVLLAVGAVSPFAGQPGNNLVMSLAGGGAFLVAAIVMALQLRKTR
ncbi:hypothetical protein [Compostimonas suwonensis]|uniref:Uncharacterized protein n=1 Tax=Compostimonas suwonensis TaxID=1048394 RepID=A0A2M9BVX5_9MICO|nr:hypothetical protein [Compostimonas suwonensis]PJJ62106.1 hypothetical protein CLV54_1899 [Compostimonas suwonensis]